MEEKVNTDQDQIVSHFHEEDMAVPQYLRETSDYKETEKIFSLQKQVAFLHVLRPEDQLWKGIETRIKPGPAIQHWFRYAAIIILSFVLGALLIYLSGVRFHEPGMASISSPRGQITSLKLFDGSTVWLNSESTIRYSSDFNTGNREVYVEGEAYFEVTRDEKRPFVVHLENSQVNVLGTSFNVKAYPGSGQVEAVLMEGKIGFTGNNQSVVLEPCERLVFTFRNGEIVKDRVDLEKTLAWKKGKYYYSNEKLSAIILQLQRWYDVEFVFDGNELSRYNFTGVIDHEKSIQYNLKLIELTNKVHVQFEGDKIIIQGR